MSDEINQCINNLYQAFRQPPPLHLDGCPCCHGEGQLRRLCQIPLSELTGDVLSGYTFSVFTTIDGEGFSYFLPRILECCWKDDFSLCDLGLVGQKLYAANWNKWAPCQVTALEAFFKAVWTNGILAKEPEHEFYLGNDWLCLIGNCVEEADFFLTQLMNHPGHVYHFYESQIKTVRKSEKLSDAFWRKSSHFHQQVVDWFQAEEVIELMARQYEEIYS